MRSTARDVQIIQELVIELARAFFLRLPDAVTDRDPVTLAAVDRRIEALLDATAGIDLGAPYAAPLPAQCSSASRRLLRAPMGSAQAKLFHSG